MPEHNSVPFMAPIPVKNPASEMYTLTVDERIEFKNELIRLEIERENEAQKDWMVQGCNYYVFISRGYFGNPSDETMHKKLDMLKVPRTVRFDLWQAFKNAS